MKWILVETTTKEVEIEANNIGEAFSKLDKGQYIVLDTGSFARVKSNPFYDKPPIHHDDCPCTIGGPCEVEEIN